MKVFFCSEFIYIIVYWGLLGIGKMCCVVVEIDLFFVYWFLKLNFGCVFWDGYEGEVDVVIDEFFGWFFCDLFCRLCDWYLFCVEMKGGLVLFCVKCIFIIFNVFLCDWYFKVGFGFVKCWFFGLFGLCFEMMGMNVLFVDGVGFEEVYIGVCYL